jgi:GTPase involved in cell partitioning and DNA repair
MIHPLIMYISLISEEEEEKEDKEELEEELKKREEKLKEQIDIKVFTKFKINPSTNG